MIDPHRFEDFEWKEWMVVVHHPGAWRPVLQALNAGQPAGCAEALDLAFPVFHYDADEDHIYSLGEPFGDPLRLAPQLVDLAALSARHEHLRFELWLYGQVYCSWVGGRVHDPELQRSLDAFLTDARAARAEAPLVGRLLEITCRPRTLEDWTTQVDTLRAYLTSQLGSSLLLEDGRTFVACFTDLQQDVSPAGLLVRASLAPLAAGRAAAWMVSTVAGALVGVLAGAEVSIELRLDGVPLASVEDGHALRSLAPILAHRVQTDAR